ncbi:MAG: hypothetical protein AAB884_02810 [Patescibacteria group bacterium]
MAIFYKIHETLIHVLKRALVLGEAILFLRLLLRFLGANPETFVVKILYIITSILIWPVNFIFPNFYWSTHLIDIITVSAMVGYFIAFWIVRGILKLVFRDQYL